MLDKTFVSDLFAEASAGLNAKRVVLCNKDTLNTPYKEGITGSAREGTAYINMTSANYGEIVYFPSGSNGIFITHKAVTWRGWHQVALMSDLPTITKHIIYKNSADNEFMSLTLLNTGNIRATILMIANDSGSEYFSGVIRINMSSQVFIEKLHGNSKTPTVSVTGNTLTLTNIGPRYNAFFASTREFVL